LRPVTLAEKLANRCPRSEFSRNDPTREHRTGSSNTFPPVSRQTTELLYPHLLPPKLLVVCEIAFEDLF
jgi:hypothetical protein